MVTPAVSDNDLARAISGGTEDVAITATPRRDRARKLQYWRKCAGCGIHTEENSWITTGPSNNLFTAQEYYGFMEVKHAQPLDERKYGSFHEGELFQPNTRFKPMIEKGGITEFPIDQMVAYGWHRLNSVRMFRPDLAEAAPADIKCELGCPNRVFTSQQVYQDHVSVMHAESAANETMGRHIQQAMAMSAMGGIDPAKFAELMGKAMAEAIAINDKAKAGA